MSPAGSPQATYEKLLDSVRKIAGDGGFVSLFLIHSTGLGSMGRRHLCQALERLLDSEHRGHNLWGWTYRRDKSLRNSLAAAREPDQDKQAPVDRKELLLLLLLLLLLPKTQELSGVLYICTLWTAPSVVPATRHRQVL